MNLSEPCAGDPELQQTFNKRNILPFRFGGCGVQSLAHTADTSHLATFVTIAPYVKRVLEPYAIDVTTQWNYIENELKFLEDKKWEFPPACNLPSPVTLQHILTPHSSETNSPRPSPQKTFYSTNMEELREQHAASITDPHEKQYFMTNEQIICHGWLSSGFFQTAKSSRVN